MCIVALDIQVDSDLKFVSNVELWCEILVLIKMSVFSKLCWHLMHKYFLIWALVCA